MRKYQESLKISSNHGLVASPPAKMKRNCKNETFPVVRYFAWKLELVSNILWMIPGSDTLLAPSFPYEN